jgi:peptidoglycan/LPS O-acetylase OafA/YrhL
MGGITICALSAGLAALAGWTLSRSTVPRHIGWVNLLGGVGILALVFSIVSPDDDGFQQEL